MSKVLVFDCDGVLADTERFGHLPAFNQMWRELGVPWQWSADQYGEKLRIGGGKERMLSLFDDPEFLTAWPQAPSAAESRKEIVAAWHKKKTVLYKEIIASGKIPPRSGVKRLSEEALEQGWLLAVASTSAPESVEAVLRHAMGDLLFRRFSLVLAGECVKAKKPAPDIYLLASKKLGVTPRDFVVIEDSGNGVEAGYEAGMKVVVTVSSYTGEDDFMKASIVLSCLGDPGREQCSMIANRTPAAPRGWFTVHDLETVLTSRTSKL
ncbi:MAG: HAD-IA family hydrolase [Armatimonadetes bacterium]|nr:HAD-IA family hydrolase [Armatimonadota bacterium]